MRGPRAALLGFAASCLMFPPEAAGAELIRAGAPVYAYVFNVESKDVTVIDTATNEVLETRPLGASVRWLSNEQDFWDGRYIWTYDVVEGTAHLIAIDPAEMRVVHRIEVGKGPAHSVQITPDRRHVLVNAAGDNIIAVVGRESLKVERTIATGEWPCDIDFSPDGKLGYVPERDQHTVASFDLASFEIVGRGALAEGSKAHMLRVAPDGNSIWVQTAAGGTNDVLDPMTLKIRVSEKLGKVPVSNAWAPDGRYAYVTHFKDNYVSVLDAKTFRETGRIPVGQGGANVAFSPDGAFAYVTLVGENKVAVIDTARMEVVKKIAAGSKPWGLVIMSPPEPG